MRHNFRVVGFEVGNALLHDDVKGGTVRLVLAFFLLLATGGSRLVSIPDAQAAAGSLCPALPAPSGTVVRVSTVPGLVNAVNSAVSGTTILVADGVYALNGAYLRFAVPNVSLRSESGNREAAILDGNFQTTEIVQIVASNVTVADLTLRKAYNHPIHVMSSANGSTLNTLIYNVHVIDAGQQAIKINPDTGGYYADYGTVACSKIELTDAGRAQIRDNCYTGGIDAHQARGWTIRDNRIEGFWCNSGLSEHGIHMWRGCRDTLIERNTLVNDARGIGLGLATDGSGRSYADNACPSAAGYLDDFGAVVRNNFVVADSSALFASQSGFDCGICAWNACNIQVLHNSVYSTEPGSTFSGIEWRFPNTRVQLINNLTNVTLRQRDGALATQNGNFSTAPAGWFMNPASGDLHLTAAASGAIDQVTAPANVLDDIDGDPRPIGSAADIGADEYGSPPPAPVSDLRVASGSAAGGVLTFNLCWTPASGADLVEIRYDTMPITPVSWTGATILTSSLAGGASTYDGSLSYSGGSLFFALKSQKTAVGWSGISNNAFWPRLDAYLPVMRR